MIQQNRYDQYHLGDIHVDDKVKLSQNFDIGRKNNFFQIYTILQTKNASESDETKISDHEKSDQKLPTTEIENSDLGHSETEMEKTSGHV